MRIHFPGSVHVFNLGIDRYPDFAIWDYARLNGFTIITKDKDFYYLSVTKGHPPKVIWLPTGNCTNNEVLKIIEFHLDEIKAFMKDNKDLLLLRSQ